MKIKKSYKSNIFKISVTAWVEECELSDGSYSILDTKDNYKYIVKKQVKFAGKPPLQRNINKIQKSGIYWKIPLNLIINDWFLFFVFKGKYIWRKYDKNLLDTTKNQQLLLLQQYEKRSFKKVKKQHVFCSEIRLHKKLQSLLL